jgi:hypothetical protein
MDLIYKIYSVWLYDNQLTHDWLFFKNRTTDFMGRVWWDAPYLMFGSSEFCASTKIYNMDKSDPDFKEKSISLMTEAAKREGILLVKNIDFITLVPCGESKISYSGATSPDDVVETEGKYKGLKKSIYTPYNVMFNETKAGFNPDEFDVMGIWNTGASQYTSYRIWEEKAERESVIRDYNLSILLNLE